MAKLAVLLCVLFLASYHGAQANSWFDSMGQAINGAMEEWQGKFEETKAYWQEAIMEAGEKLREFWEKILSIGENIKESADRQLQEVQAKLKTRMEEFQTNAEILTVCIQSENNFSELINNLGNDVKTCVDTHVKACEYDLEAVKEKVEEAKETISQIIAKLQACKEKENIMEIFSCAGDVWKSAQSFVAELWTGIQTEVPNFVESYTSYKKNVEACALPEMSETFEIYMDGTVAEIRQCIRDAQ